MEGSKGRPHSLRLIWVLPTPPLPSRNSFSSASTSHRNSASAKWARILSRTFSFLSPHRLDACELAAVDVAEGGVLAEPPHRLHVLQLHAPAQVEGGELAEPPQRLEVRQPFATAQVERGELAEPPQRLHARQLLAPV